MVMTRMLSNMYTFGVQECPVCYEKYTAVDAAFLRNCSHVVCIKCAISLLETNEQCPLCRNPFSKTDTTFTVIGKPDFNVKLKEKADKIRHAAT